ncbi:MAG: mechanosensitive ion channel [Bacteroidales bacterium]|nr:mechanosensitive ion channel [Bacteroidales bacterium]
MFRLLQALPSVPTTESVNVADSVRTAAQNLAQEIADDPSAFMSNLLQDFVDFGMKVLGAIAIYIIGAWVIKRVKRSISKFLERKKTEPTMASFITSLTSILMTLFLILMTIGALGVNTTSIAAMLGAGAMAIGMALSGTMENFAGGLIILLFKPFKVGDFISVQGFSGTVTDVTIVNTKILTTDNRCIMIPNGALSNGTIDNFSLKPIRRLEWKVGVEYGTDVEKCIAAMVNIAEKDQRILNSEFQGAENPYAVLSSMKDSSVELSLRAWVKAEDYWSVNFDINKELYERLPELGFNFAYPHLDVKVNH